MTSMVCAGFTAGKTARGGARRYPRPVSFDGQEVKLHHLSLSLIAAYLLVSCGTSGPTVIVDQNGGALPQNIGATPAQVLARSLTYRGMHGVAMVTVTTGGMPNKVAGALGPQTPVTDYGALLTAVAGADTVGRQLPAHLLLRVPGDSHTHVEDAPKAFSPTETLAVWIQDQPATGLAGASSNGVLVVASDANVAVVNGSAVGWIGSTFSYGQFISVLRANPAHG